MSGPDVFMVASVSHEDMAEIWCNGEPYSPRCDDDEDVFVRKADYDRDLTHLAHHRDQLAAQNEHLVKILSNITLCLPPPPVKLDDGRTMQFVDPDPARTLNLLQRSIQQAMTAVNPSSEPK